MSSYKKIQNETPEIRSAFEYWYNNGNEPRSISDVAKQFEKSRKTIHNYAKSFKWDERAEIRRAEAVGEMKKKAETGEINDLGVYRRMFRDLMKKAEVDIREGRLKIRSIKDLTMVAELELRILEQERELEAQGNLQEGKLESLVDVFRNMPMTADPRSGMTIEQKTTMTVQSTRETIDAEEVEGDN